MRVLKFLLSFLLTLGIILALNSSFPVKGKPIPALGTLINPFSGFWQNGEPSNPLPLSAIADSLQSEVKVVYDDRRIPHIYAQNLQDAYWVQGFITAKDRLWQMDFITRNTSGRLSEVVGSRMLETDKEKRRKGMVYAAENTIEGWKKDAEGHKLLESFVKGVNAYIHSLKPKDYPVEFKLLNYKPEDWTPLKTALFTKAMGETLAGRYDDLDATNTLAKIGEDAFQFLFPERFPEQLPIIPREVKYDFKPIPFKDTVLTNPTFGALGYEKVSMPDNNLGSNNWAVAKGKTANGKPILCGDPHLLLTLPSIWYEIHINTPTSNAYGVSLPGVPGVVIGFNDDIAWSQTNVGHDVADLYSITWKDATKQEYLLDDKYVPVKNVVETYKVRDMEVPFGRGKKEIKDTIRFTHWGPIIYESKDLKEKDLALRWLVHDKPDIEELSVFSKLDEAKNYEEFSKAIEPYISPAQNFVFACKDGTIAMNVQGKFPLKENQQGRFIQDGSKTANAWKGFVPVEHNPKVVSPHWGYVASANQHSTEEKYPYYYNREYFEAYRGRVLQQKLQDMDSITIEDMQRLQYNSHSVKAEDAIPLFIKNLKVENLNAEEKAVVDALSKWDFNYVGSKIEPLYFELWFESFYKLTWDDMDEKDKLLSPSDWRTIYILRDLPQSNYFNIDSTQVRETAADILELSLKIAVKKFQEEKNKNPELNWSSHRNLTIRHLAQIPSFSRKNVYTDGHPNTLNAVRSVAGPSWRMVVELGDKTKAWVVYPGGQSGNPGSIYYDNFVDTWAAGKYYEAQLPKNPEAITGNNLLNQVFKPR